MKLNTLNFLKQTDFTIYSQELSAFKNSTINEIDNYIINRDADYTFLEVEDAYTQNELNQYIYEEMSINTYTLKNMCNEVNESFIETYALCKNKIETEETSFPIINFSIAFNLIKHYAPEKYFVALVSLALQSSGSTNLEKYLTEMVNFKISQNNLKKLYNALVNPNKVFIAMSFSDTMNAAREAIKSAIVNAGYAPTLIDEKEHNDFIVPEILKEIEDSLFVVADITGQKNGVYYEAGYAKGLNKQVIFTCQKENFKDAHFDINQINTILWSDEEDLALKLAKRIECYDDSNTAV